MVDPFKHTRDLRRAFGLISVVPTRVEWLPERGPQVAGWFTWVGFALGAVTVAPLLLLDDVLHVERVPALLVSALLLVAWGLLTRLLHWDGVADVADAIWGGSSVERRLEIMKDSATGAFGTAAVVLLALVEIGALVVLVGAGWNTPIVWALTVSRMAPTFAAWLGKPARPGGLGASVCGKPAFPAMIAAALGLALGAAPMLVRHPSLAAWPLGVGLVAALVVPHLVSEPFGGVTGDVMGASVQITEVVTLVAAALVIGVGR